MIEPTATSADLGDVSLHYAIRGQGGPWVTLIHGGMMPSVTWTAQSQRLADAARVLTFDVRGYGASSRPADGYSVEQLSDDMLRLWDAVGIDRSVVVGFSMGGFVAIEAALAAPERVQALMLVGSAGGLPPPAGEVFLRRASELERTGGEAQRRQHVDRVFSEAFRNANPALMESYADAVGKNDPLSMAAVFRGLAQFDRRQDLTAIACPVLIVCGEQDAALPVERSQALHAALPGSRLVIVPGAGHTLHLEQPNVFERLVRDVLHPG